MTELSSRRGFIKGIDVQTRNALIRASLPAEEYDGLEKAMDEGTQHRGRIERASRQ
jgi:translation elongation factor EF-G